MSEPRVYYADEFVTLYHGDCRDVLPTLQTVDLVLAASDAKWLDMAHEEAVRIAEHG